MTFFLRLLLSIILSSWEPASDSGTRATSSRKAQARLKMTTEVLMFAGDTTMVGDQ